MEFTSRLENFNTRLWSYHIKVPRSVALAFQEKGIKRVVCTLNHQQAFQCAIMPAGDGVYFINVNKKIRDTLKLKEGHEVAVSLEEDSSEFGLPFPEELEAALQEDQEGKALFDALTPGKKRNLLYGVSQVKSSDLRIQRAWVMIRHLKNNQGKINFKQLYQELRLKD